MFGLFKKKQKSGGDEPPQNDEAAFMQAVVNKFVTMLDAHKDSNPDIPEFRDRWMFELQEVSAWMQSETSGRMSCRIIAKDSKKEFPDFAEWAHGFGETIDAAFDRGFSNWFETDLPVLVDVIQEESVLSQDLVFPIDEKTKKVRAILGPMQFWSLGSEAPEPCCNSCIFSQAMLATDYELKNLKRPSLIKAVVARNPDNTTTCDFRINEEQNEQIAAALSEWAKSWDGEGFAMRKQSLLFVEA